MSVLVVTGTGTGVGKTVVAAAVGALARNRGLSVSMVKPAQTGVRPGEPADLETVRRLAGIPDLHEWARYPDPLSPAAAARRSGAPRLDVERAAERVLCLSARRQLVLVEGAGGLLVRYDDEGRTLADLARRVGAPVLVVVEAGLGTLNSTALTLEALAHRGLELAGVVIGSWPQRPDLAAISNLGDLERLAGRPLAGVLPAGAGRLPPEDFLVLARAGLGPAYGGRFDAADFRRAADPALRGTA